MFYIEFFDKNKARIIFFILTIALGITGLVILLATTSVLDKETSNVFFYFTAQLKLTIIGLILFFITSHLDISFWYKWAWFIYLISIVFLIILFIPNIGNTVGGATRWISISNISFQPSDFTKISILIVISRLFAIYQNNISIARIGVITCIIVIPILFITVEPDLGTALHILTSTASLLIFTSFPISILLSTTFLSIPILYYSIISTPYRFKRITSFLDPYENRYTGGFQLIASYKSFIAGKWFGQGLGEGVRRHTLQARHTDFILSIIVEDLGFLGVLALLILFTFISLYGLFLMKNIPNTFARILGTGIILTFIWQALINLAVVMGLIPTTGINLPFISYGGSSLLSYYIMFGIFLSTLRADTKEGGSTTY